MAAKTPTKAEILAAFFDEGSYAPLYEGGAVSAAFGSAGGQSAYAVWQDGGALDVADLQKNIHLLSLAAETGNPVVTFYNASGARLAGGLELLKTNARLMAAIAKVSGVVPQVAVVVGTCAGSAAVQAAAADVCVMAEGAELFLSAPFNTEDAPADAASAAYAARAGVAAVVTPDAVAAARAAAQLVGLLPANNLAAPALFDAQPPKAAFTAKPYDAAKAAEAIADAGSLLPLFTGIGKRMFTGLGTVNGNVVGIVATGEPGFCHNCAAKAARFVRLCDAYSIPLVTVVNTAGFRCSCEEDVQGGIRQAARMAGVYADATTVKVAVLAGQAIGPVYTAFAGTADWRIAVEGCTVAPLAPAAAVSVLYKDEIEASDNIRKATAAKAAAYAVEQCGAAAAVAANVADCACAPAAVRGQVSAALDMLSTKRAVRLAKKHGTTAL